jgi:hypothetical protein
MQSRVALGLGTVPVSGRIPSGLADQAIRHNETEQARHYLTAAVAELPEGIPHLAIRSASLAASIGETELAKHLVDKIPQSRTWPSYLKHLVVRLRSIEP